ncbi:MAG: T9SS type A sorting domain-containing protein [Chitinophagaceae bacterium]|nr:T9SS type A sorting domain-containing protein [Chitinophagaceae bacterium]
MLQIDSRTLAAGAALVYAYYKTSAINGPPGAISAANGWVQFGAAAITGTGSAVQPFISNLQLVIPAGTSYGICLQAITITYAPNLSYSTLSPGNYSFNDGGCEIITGTNIGYSGINIPSAPNITPAGFIGAVHFAQASLTCTSPPRTVVVTVGQAISITQQPVNQAVCVGNSAGFSVAMAGAGPFIYQWQLSSNAGATYSNIVNGGIFSGALTATLLINTPPVTMNGYLFRVAVNGGSGCSGATSAAALLTVYPLPNIVITANPLIIGPGQTTTIYSTVTPNPAATYTWYYNGTVLPGATADTLLVDISGLGDYQLKVTDVNGCTDLSNIITIVHSFAVTLFTYPNPSAGIFQVRYFSEANNTLQRSLMVYNNRGERIITRAFTQTIPYQKIDIDIRAHGKGLYWIELRDAGGKRLAVNRAVVQ